MDAAQTMAGSEVMAHKNGAKPEKQVSPAIANRNPKTGQFVKGVSGNPNGRPRGKTPSEYLRARLERGRTYEQIMDKVTSLAVSGERWAVELLFDRMEGKPLQVIDIEQRILAAARAGG